MIAVAAEVAHECNITLEMEDSIILHPVPKIAMFVDDGGTEMEVNMIDDKPKEKPTSKRIGTREKASEFRGGVRIFPESNNKIDRVVGKFLRLLFERALGEEIPASKIEALISEIAPPEKPTSKNIGEELGLVPPRLRNFLRCIGMLDEFNLASRKKLAYRAAVKKVERKFKAQTMETTPKKASTRKKVSPRKKVRRPN